jgi:hypothetical protein
MELPTQESRQKVRVRIRNSSVRVLHPVMPSLDCRMLDLSEGGVRCKMDINPLDNFAATAWRQLLSSGKLLSVELAAPGVGQRCQLLADVRHVRLGHDNDITFGLKFHRPNSMQQEIVAQAMLAYGRKDAQDASDSGEDEAPLKPSLSPPARPTSTVIINPTKKLAGKTRPAPTLAEKARALWRKLLGRQPKSVNFRGMKIGEILMRNGRITPTQAVEAYEQSRATGRKFGRYLVSESLITPAELCRALSMQTGMPVVDLSTVTLPETVRKIFSRELLKEHQFVPFNEFGPELYIAVTTPLSKGVLTELERQCECRVKVFLAREDVVSLMLDSPFFADKESDSSAA